MGLDAAQAAVLESLGRRFEAAEVHREEGRFREAAELFLQVGTELSVKRAEACVIDGFWHHLPFGVDPNPEPDVLSKLLECSAKLKQASPDIRANEEVGWICRV